MKPGSVVVDIAAPKGGNCELTKPGEVYTHTNGVKIVGYEDLPSRMSTICSQLYGTNLCHLLKDMQVDGAYAINLDDEVVRGAIIIQDGAELPPPPKVDPTSLRRRPPIQRLRRASPSPKQRRPSLPFQSRVHRREFRRQGFNPVSGVIMSPWLGCGDICVTRILWAQSRRFFFSI